MMQHRSTVGGGRLNRANENASTVIGGFTNIANGEYSTVSGGRDNTAQSYGEWVGGIYATVGVGNSTAIVATDRLFVVGNGTGTAARSNALTLYKNGSLEINEAYTFPNVDGINTQVLTTNGLGIVSWQTSTDDQTLTLGAGTATTSILDIESSATDITIQAETGITLSELGNTLTIAGNSASPLRTETSNYTAVPTDATILIDASSGAVTITLPSAIANPFKKFIVKSIDVTNSIILNATAGNIDGSPTQNLNVLWQGLEIQSNGANWFIVGRF